MKIQPTFKHILIKLVNEHVDSGLVLPEGTRLNPYGEVLAIGPDVTTCTVGDKLLFMPEHAIGFNEGEDEVFIINEGVVFGKYVPENAQNLN